MTEPSQRPAQRLLFSGLQPTAPDGLYVRVQGSTAVQRKTLELRPGATASTDTYFGRFAASYWQRWTDVRAVTLRMNHSGRGELRLWASDADGGRRVIEARALDGTGVAELTAPLDRFLDGGAMWVEVQAGDDSLRISDAAWFAPGAGPDRVQVAICTYNRPDDCTSMLLALGAEDAVAELVSQVVVVDQGNNLVEAHQRFGDVSSLWGDRLCYLRQRNLGGAGGFARGMIEARRARHKSHAAHVLLMDDDIILEPDTVLRLVAFGDSARTPTIVGGQMLYQMHPHVLHVAGETADLPNLRAGRPTPGALWAADMTQVAQEDRVDATYNGWWCCLIPHEVLDRVGLPLPLFFQWDDIEFGHRALRHGVRTVTLHGAGIWHADFSWKDPDDWFRYFSQRNSMITYALYGQFDGPRLARQMWLRLVKSTVSMQYGLAWTLIKAVEDFLGGPEALEDGGTAAMQEVRTLRAAHDETALVSPGAGPAGALPPVDRLRGIPTRPILVLAKRLTYQGLGRVGGEASIPFKDARWWHVSLFEKAVVTDASQRGVRVRSLDRAEARSVLVQAASVCLRLAKEGTTVAGRYRDAVVPLASEAAWCRRIGLPPDYASTPPLTSLSPEAK